MAQELWTGKIPHCDHLRIIGCEAYVHVSKKLRKKLDYKCRKCIFLGYAIDGQFGYLLWNLDTRIVVKSRDLVFCESKMHKQSIEVEVRRWYFRMLYLLLT